MAPLRVIRTAHKAVMPGLDPGIHLLSEKMDCRVKPGNDASHMEARPPHPFLPGS
jgi:hypothetical protein